MKFYSEAAMERAMKIQEVILRAIGKRINWWQAAEIIGISDRLGGLPIGKLPAGRRLHRNRRNRCNRQLHGGETPGDRNRL